MTFVKYMRCLDIDWSKGWTPLGSFAMCESEASATKRQPERKSILCFGMSRKSDYPIYFVHHRKLVMTFC